jgi:TolA-binding protein
MVKVNKIILSGLLVLGTLSIVATSVFAEDSSSSASPVGTNQKQTQRISNLKTRADTEISRRINDLNKLIDRLNGMKRLSDSQKTTFVSGIQSEVSSLSTLKSKIDADTDVATLKSDVQSIVGSYRVYLVFMPQIQIMSAADRIDTSILSVNSMVTKLNDRIGKAKAAGSDVTAVEALVADMTAKSTDAQSQADSASAEVASLTPSGYPGNTSQLKDARSKIQAATADLKIAVTDAQTVIKDLKALVKSSPNPTL